MFNWYFLFIFVIELNKNEYIWFIVGDVCFGNNIYGIVLFIVIMIERNIYKIFFNLYWFCFI